MDELRYFLDLFGFFKSSHNTGSNSANNSNSAIENFELKFANFLPMASERLPVGGKR